MNPSPSSTRQRHNAFTLLEVIMVLAVIAMVVALAAGMFVAADNGPTLTGPPADLANMTKAASRGAVVQGHPVVIAFDEKGFGVAGGSGGSSSVPKTTAIKWQRWNSGKKWNDAKGLNWTFFPTGICDALRFRFEEPDQIVELAFHPLTGSITEQIVLRR